MRSLSSAPSEKYRFIYHFLPRKETRARARLLTHNALISYSLLLILFLIAGKFIPHLKPGVLGYASHIEVPDLLRYTNETRQRIGLKTLKLNDELNLAAQKKAEDMFKVGYWAHVSPSGTKPWDFILSEGYDYIYAGENLAKNFSNSSDVVKAWYESPSHRENLLSSNYDDIGFAVVNGVLDGYETTLVVQMFGRTRSSSVVAGDSAPKSGVLVENDTSLSKAPSPLAEDIKQAVGEKNQVDQAPVFEKISTPSFIDVRKVSVSIIVVFSLFLTVLLSLDIWYSEKHGILKVTGHTLAHLVFLIVVLATVMVTILPGAIL